MSEHRFSKYQRFAVYKAFKGVCQWCHEPAEFVAINVDHVIPESLSKDPLKLLQVFQSFNLPASFDLNGYENLAPLHTYCNQLKSAKVYEGAGMIRTILDKCEALKENARRIEISYNNAPEKAKLLAMVQAAMEKRILDIKELNDFLLGKDLMDSDDKDLNWIREQLQGKLDYQMQVQGIQIMDMVNIQALEMLEEMSKALGSGWGWGFAESAGRMACEISYQLVTTYSLKNKANTAYSVDICLGQNIQDKSLTIDLVEVEVDGSYQIIETVKCQINEGLNWPKFRNIYKGHYKRRIAEKLNLNPPQ